MSKQVLFVDDEVSLLNGIERRLAGQFNLATANSGAAALDLMQSNGPFAVVVTDMPHAENGWRTANQGSAGVDGLTPCTSCSPEIKTRQPPFRR